MARRWRRMLEHSQNPRDQILHALKMEGALQVRAIAEAVGSSLSAVRPHLDRLVAESLVRVEIVRGGLGRPRHRYTLTSTGHARFPQSYGEFAKDFVEAVLAFGGQDLLSRILTHHENKQYQRFAPRLAGLDFHARVQELRRILDECGFMPRVEQTDDGYVLAAHHCPIWDVAATCRAGCDSELRLIRRLVEADVVPLEVGPRVGCACRYAIHEQTALPQASSSTT